MERRTDYRLLLPSLLPIGASVVAIASSLLWVAAGASVLWALWIAVSWFILGRRALVIGVVCIGILWGFFALVTPPRGGSDPAAAAQTFTEAIQVGDWSAAIDVVPPEYRSVWESPFKEVAAWMNRYAIDILDEPRRNGSMFEFPFTGETDRPGFDLRGVWTVQVEAASGGWVVVAWSPLLTAVPADGYLPPPSAPTTG